MWFRFYPVLVGRPPTKSTAIRLIFFFFYTVAPSDVSNFLFYLCMRSTAHCVLLSTNSRFVCHPLKDHLVQSDFSFKWELSCVLETQPLIRTHYRHRRREDGEPSNCGMSQNLVATLLHPHDSIRCHVLVGQLRLPWMMEGVWHQLWTILSLLIYFLIDKDLQSRCI